MCVPVHEVCGLENSRIGYKGTKEKQHITFGKSQWQATAPCLHLHLPSVLIRSAGNGSSSTTRNMHESLAEWPVLPLICTKRFFVDLVEFIK